VAYRLMEVEEEKLGRPSSLETCIGMGITEPREFRGDGSYCCGVPVGMEKMLRDSRGDGKKIFYGIDPAGTISCT